MHRRGAFRGRPADGGAESRFASAFDAAELAGVAPFVPPPPTAPAVVSPYQARAALSRAGLLASVEAAVAAAGREVQIAWEYGLEVRRDSPMIAALAQAVGLTAQAVDDLFVAAGGIA